MGLCVINSRRCLSLDIVLKKMLSNSLVINVNCTTMYCSGIDGGHHLEFETWAVRFLSVCFQWLLLTPSTCSNYIITADCKFQTHTHTHTHTHILDDIYSSSSSSLGEYTHEIFLYFVHATYVAMVTGVG